MALPTRSPPLLARGSGLTPECHRAGRNGGYTRGAARSAAPGSSSGNRPPRGRSRRDAKVRDAAFPNVAETRVRAEEAGEDRPARKETGRPRSASGIGGDPPPGAVGEGRSPN